MHEALRNVEQQECLGKQLVVGHVEAKLTGASRRQLKKQIKFNTDGHEKANASAKLEADVSKASRAEGLASFQSNVRGRYAVRFHDERGELVEGGAVICRQEACAKTVSLNGKQLDGNACQPLCREGSQYARSVVNKSNDESKKCKCRGCAWLQVGLAITIKDNCKF